MPSSFQSNTRTKPNVSRREMFLVPILKVGHLVPGTIVKSLPNYDAHLAIITGTEIMARLPRKYANRHYKVGDRILAAVFTFDDHKITLSQRSPQYFRRLAQLLFMPLIEDGRVTIKRAASVEKAGFAKISIAGHNGTDPVKECLPYLKEAKLYTDHTITLIRHDPDMAQYVVNSLAPGPADKVYKVIYSSNYREARVRVDPAYYGLFVGKGGVNVACAAKLLDIQIAIIKAV